MAIDPGQVQEWNAIKWGVDNLRWGSTKRIFTLDDQDFSKLSKRLKGKKAFTESALRIFFNLLTDRNHLL